jgi:hypothetical protein
MRFPLPIVLLTIVLGTLETAGGAQELVYQGIVTHYAGWPMTTVGIVYLLFLIVFYGRRKLRNNFRREREQGVLQIG